VDKALEDLVKRRAREACEYCHMPQAVHPSPFQIDHIIAQQHHGPTTADNLAWSCLRCNSHKGPNLSGYDWETGEVVRLFNPRQDTWGEHFEWDGPYLRGRTQVGRATIDVLTINHPAYVELRASLIAEGVFPPKS
jgi:hypothetical protein